MNSTLAQRERIPTVICDDDRALAREVAARVAERIRGHAREGRPIVLGLPTGSTPIGVYREWIRLHREEGLSFRHVVTFNLDEYYPMRPDSLQSYHRFMWENLFDHVDIERSNVHIPDGTLPRRALRAHCARYEKMIAAAGGIDVQLLGIGRTGHIGFNEPGSDEHTRTRLIVLDEVTRKDAAADFYGEEHVPREAITMGVGTILEAREVILMATGEHKAEIVRRAVEEPMSPAIAASYLQRHGGAVLYVDRAAAGELTRVKTPWLVGTVEWTAQRRDRAVVWLSLKQQRSILKLTAADYLESRLHALLNQYDSVDALNRRVFDALAAKITHAADLPARKRVLIFSPHPDDDVICMGGTMAKLARQGNDVHVAYMTSGNIAVFDHDVRRYLDFIDTLARVWGTSMARFEHLREEIESFLQAKRPAQPDIQRVLDVKAAIRRSEAVSAIQTVGLPPENAHFLDLPFYRTGQVRKLPIGEDDVRIVLDMLRKWKPDIVFLAGDMSDPHGTHRMCLDAIQAALERLRGARPACWLYRGAWQEWDVDEADVFVSLTQGELSQKITAIFKHQSQKDRAMFPGAHDEREFWQRVEARNRQTADQLNRLGLAEHYAMEAFVVQKS